MYFANLLNTCVHSTSERHEEEDPFAGLHSRVDAEEEGGVCMCVCACLCLCLCLCLYLCLCPRERERERERDILLTRKKEEETEEEANCNKTVTLCHTRYTLQKKVSSLLKLLHKITTQLTPENLCHRRATAWHPPPEAPPQILASQFCIPFTPSIE